MNTFHRLLRSSTTSKFPNPINSHHLRLTHSVALNSISLHAQARTNSQLSLQDAAKAIATSLSNCSTLQELNQIYAHITRTQLLHLYPAPFNWNNIIRAYTRLDDPIKAVEVYISMSKAGVFSDSYTLPIVLKAACHLFAIGFGKQLHSIAVKLGLESNEYCESGFINLYAKAGDLKSAYKVFDENPERKLGSWNAIIGALSQGGRAREAIDMFIEMRKCGFCPDGVTMVSVISACGSLGDLSLAIQLHKCVFQANDCGKPDIIMMNSLIDMYGKCGRMDLARRVFCTMGEKNVSSWTSMVVGYAMHGHANEAIECFHGMREAGVRPNHVTFIGVLSACVHGGMVQQGKHFFEMMRNVYSIVPQTQHYGCMVDMLGRVGLLGEAREIVEGMPMEPNVVIWGCLMGACEKYGDVKMGEWVAKYLHELEPWNDGVFVVLSNIYASRGLWQEVERIRVVMKQQRLAKLPAYSVATSSN